MRLFLSTLAISLFFCPLFASMQPLPQDPTLIQTTLADGTQLYTKEHTDQHTWASFRVVFRYSNEEHALFSFESEKEDWEAVDEFLFACAKEAKTPGSLLTLRRFPSSFSSLVNQQAPSAICVIGIGSMSRQELEKRVGSCFTNIYPSKPVLLYQRVAPVTIDTSDLIEPAHVAIHLSFPPITRPLETFEDLKLSWQQLFLQELLQQRFEECTKRTNELWIHPHPRGLYPSCGYALASEDSIKNLFSFFVWHLEMLKNQNLSSELFAKKKQELLYRLSYLCAHKDHPTSGMLASYCTDLFLLGAPGLSFPSFVTASLQDVQELEEEDLIPLLPSFLAKERRSLHLIYASHLHKNPLDEPALIELEEQISALIGESTSSQKELSSEEEGTSRFPFPSAPIPCSYDGSLPEFVLAAATAPSSFYKLPLSLKEQEFITSIITTMAENNIFQLAMHKSSLEKKGKKIDHVHPLRFMGHILSNPVLKNHVRTIRKSSFKWDALISGFSKKMREQMGRNNVYPHLDGFAALVGSSKEAITPYIQKADFEGLVKSLL